MTIEDQAKTAAAAPLESQRQHPHEEEQKPQRPDCVTRLRIATDDLYTVGVGEGSGAARECSQRGIDQLKQGWSSLTFTIDAAGLPTCTVAARACLNVSSLCPHVRSVQHICSTRHVQSCMAMPVPCKISPIHCTHNPWFPFQVALRMHAATLHTTRTSTDTNFINL
jgi:hypothetical protein